MSRETSPGTAKPDGQQRVCRAQAGVVTAARAPPALAPSIPARRRARARAAQARAGRIVTDPPNALWGTDGLRIETVEDGWVGVFTAVDHFDACCVGHHGVKMGRRFAALAPIALGLTTSLGSTAADAGRGLAWRMDHGTQYTADPFLNQIRC